MYKGPKGYKKLYEEYGGKGLGKILAKDLALLFPNLVVPQTFCKKISDILSGEDIESTEFGSNTDVVIKFSKVGDDFSDEADRGKNTSLGLPKIKSGENIPNSVRDVVFSQNITDDIRALILDEMIKVSNGLLFLVVFEGDTMKLEISKNDRERLYYVMDSNGEIIFFEKNSDEINHQDIPKEVFETMFRIHKAIYEYFGRNISVNTEGFFENGNYIMIQVRPTPNEKVGEQKNLPDGITYSSEIVDTNFVYGIFDVEGFLQTINEDNYLSADNCIFILDENTRWFNPLIKERIEKGLPTILIDTYDGFHISHDPKLLPKPGIYREGFNYISYFSKTKIVGKKVRVTSTGEKGRILVYKENTMSKDKFNTNEKKKCNFTFLNKNFNFPIDKVTSVAIIAFNDNGKIISIKLDRGIDIPGGHIKEGETIIEALKRECMEEAFIEIDDIKISSIIESDFFGKTPDKLTYMLIYTGKVKNKFDFIENDESFARLELSPEEFLNKYNGDKSLMKRIIEDSILNNN